MGVARDRMSWEADQAGCGTGWADRDFWDDPNDPDYDDSDPEEDE